ncbi:hypothetical protein U1Q18_041248 [Sarracenia purpurea var. burkii]
MLLPGQHPFLGCYDSTGSEPKKGRTPWGSKPLAIDHSCLFTFLLRSVLHPALTCAHSQKKNVRNRYTRSIRQLDIDQQKSWKTRREKVSKACDRWHPYPKSKVLMNELK